jgi:LysR family transcriptional regulator, glycine cleavage system transcriptional activator
MNRFHGLAGSSRHTGTVYRHLPPLHTLEAFEAAARLAAFSRAGDELGLSQSAISHRIKLLEETLGVTLFVRLPRQVVLTPQGEHFRDTVAEALGRLRSAARGPDEMDLPPLHAITAFEAISRHGTFARAAAELFLTDSAVSHRIRALETRLGSRLFERSSHGTQLTAEGTAFLAEVKVALAALQAGAARIGKNRSTVVRLSVLPAFASGWLIQRMGSFHRRHPDIELDISTTSQLANVKAGEADAAVRYGLGPWPGTEADRLFEDVVFPAASPEYLGTVPPIHAPGDLQGVVFLRHRLLPWRRWFAAAGLDWPEPTSRAAARGGRPAGAAGLRALPLRMEFPPRLQGQRPGTSRGGGLPGLAARRGGEIRGRADPVTKTGAAAPDPFSNERLPGQR